MKVTHVITGLGNGGAEAMLCKLVSATRADGLSHSVVSLTDGGVHGRRLEAEGVRVSCLGMRPGVPDPRGVVRLVRLFEREHPDLVQGWMYHANLVAGVAALPRRLPVVWGVHHADVDAHNVKRLTHFTRALSARLSGVLADKIICCGESAASSHARLGYRTDRLVVIPNGFDLARYAPDPAARARLREELSISAGAPVVGLVARFHPDKDHRNFLEAVRQVAAVFVDAVFLLAGPGIEWSNLALSTWIRELGIASRVKLLGARSDVPGLLSALDVLASSSRSEGFPQVLGEAMACQVPCAATDCGDCREIVGPTGRVVPPGSSTALAGAIGELLSLEPGQRAALGAAARERIAARYDLSRVARRYASVYSEVLAARLHDGRAAGTGAAA